MGEPRRPEVKTNITLTAHNNLGVTATVTTPLTNKNRPQKFSKFETKSRLSPNRVQNFKLFGALS